MTRLRFQKFIEPLLILLFLAALGLLINEVDWIENTLGGTRLFFLALTGGGVLGLAAGAFFAFFRHDLLSGLSSPVTRSIAFTGGVALTLGFSFAAGASYFNRIQVQEAREVTFTVADKFYGRGQARTPRLVIQDELGGEENIMVDRPFWNDVAAGDKIVLGVSRGAFGYDVVSLWAGDALEK
ncbi:hypothetical protein [Massilia yuzhufengensis]|uniref:Uncharacterized protein n=1 Tax=Massilia yuzhufengensis TaxID=1164594 RepID=A0A1I1LU97_9BURK|nr:hypothetical protein [Massilia yuzhufengensis]SFC73040.1 hypothetical protein SAMN05216204_109116 [Massilia yuzhufengensis]